MQFLEIFWTKWLKFARRLSDQVARIMLMTFYFTFALPFGIGARFTDALGLKRPPGWFPKNSGEDTIESARRLF